MEDNFYYRVGKAIGISERLIENFRNDMAERDRAIKKHGEEIDEIYDVSVTVKGLLTCALIATLIGLAIVGLMSLVEGFLI